MVKLFQLFPCNNSIRLRQWPMSPLAIKAFVQALLVIERVRIIYRVITSNALPSCSRLSLTLSHSLPPTLSHSFHSPCWPHAPLITFENCDQSHDTHTDIYKMQPPFLPLLHHCLPPCIMTRDQANTSEAKPEARMAWLKAFLA